MLQNRVERGAAFSSTLQKAAALVELPVSPVAEPCKGSLVSVSLSESGNAEEAANLGGRFLPVPPTLLGVGVANQIPCFTPYFSALLHLQLLFFLRAAAAGSVPEVAKLNITLIWVLQSERVWGKQIWGKT